jgi:hypothetical protein
MQLHSLGVGGDNLVWHARVDHANYIYTIVDSTVIVFYYKGL